MMTKILGKLTALDNDATYLDPGLVQDPWPSVGGHLRTPSQFVQDLSI